MYYGGEVLYRQGFEISRATQSVWCGDVADLVEPLYALMTERVRASHVVATDDTILPMLSKGKPANARMWVYVGDASQPYNIFDFTLDRGRECSSAVRMTCLTLFSQGDAVVRSHLGELDDDLDVLWLPI